MKSEWVYVFWVAISGASWIFWIAHLANFLAWAWRSFFDRCLGIRMIIPELVIEALTEFRRSV